MSDWFGTGGTETTSTTEIPPYIQSASKAAAEKAQALAEQPYEQYQGPRVAPLSGLQQRGIDYTESQLGAYEPAFERAQGVMAGAEERALGTRADLAGAMERARGTEGTFAGALERARRTAPAIASARERAAGTEQTFDAARAQARRAGQRQFTDEVGQYMSPYVEEAIEPQLRELREQNAQLINQQRADITGQGGAGAFGGARAALADAEQQERTMQTMSDVTRQGYERAFDRAGRLFAQDVGIQQRAAGQRADIARANLAGAQAELAAAETDLAAAGREGALGARQLQGAAREGALAGQQMEGARLEASLADQYGTLAGKEATIARSNIQQALQAGEMPRQVEQASYDTAYQDYLEQRDWDQRGLDTYLRALSGVPFEETTTQTQVQEQSTGQTLGQLAGAAATAYGAYDSFFSD